MTLRHLYTLAVTVLLAACGGSSTPVNPVPDDPGNSTCAATLTEDISVSTVMVNSPSACDYLIAPAPSDIGYRVLTVTNGTLSVEPGTVVRFAEGGGLQIGTNASLQAVGLADARIRFEGAAAIRGYGLGIFLEPDSLASTVAYTDFAYLGREDIGTFKFWNGALGGLYGGGLRLTDTTIMGSNFFGADLGSLPLLEFRRNFFYDNARAGLSVIAPQVALLDAGTDYLGGNYPNGEPYIHIGGLEPLLVDTVWEARNAPYLIDGALYVEGATFVPAPGVQIVFAEGSGMVVSEGGTLYALGTAQYPVVFTGKEPVAGYWDSLVFTDASPNSRLEHTYVSYGGGGTIYEGNVFIAYQDALYIANSTITDSTTWGVCADSAATLTQGPGNVFRNNALDDVNTACDEF